MSQPRDDLRDELAETEGEPSEPGASIPPGFMPDRLGRVVPVEDHWRDHLVMGEKKVGKSYVAFVESHHANVTTILLHHPRWQGVVAYDEFRETVATLEPPPWNSEDAPERPYAGAWTDEDTSRLSSWLVRSPDKLKLHASEVEAGLSVAAHKRRVHPVRAYLRGLTWDGVPRLDSLMPAYFGTEDGLYEQAAGSKWAISAVARVMEPGCQADLTLIVEGWQGARKSSGFRAMVPNHEWYSETGITIGTKDSYGALHAVWIYGFDELDSIHKGDTTKTKSFLTATKDKYRPPYGHRDKIYLRQTVFCGTTNQIDYLQDRTGNRRYLPVRCRRRVDVDAIERDRDQLWAEAVTRYDAGEKWYVETDGLAALCAAQQAERVQPDTWLELVAAWLEKPTQVEMWGAEAHRVPLDVSSGVTTGDVLLNCVNMPRKDLTLGHEKRVGEILRELGYEPTQRREGGSRVRRYVKAVPPDPEPADEGP